MDNEQTAVPQPQPYPQNVQPHEENNDQMNGQENQQAADDGQEFKPMDLTPYEDDTDETLHWKLVAAKQERKKAEADLKLLCNRIGLLKQEECKANKKIEETRKRANDILAQRQRNQDHNRAKMARLAQQQAEVDMKTQQHKNMKEQQRQQVEMNKKMSYDKTKAEANDTKAVKNEVKQRYQQNRQLEENRAQGIKHMIRQQQIEAQYKKQQEFNEKQNRARAQVNDKMQREAQQRLEHEKEIERMEREEQELIMRLQNTKVLEQAAHQELENTMNNPQLMADAASQQSSQKGRGKPASTKGTRR